MPLTAWQAELGRLLAANRSPDSYLAGAAALLVQPHTVRFSQDLDYFHDTPERVASAYDADRRSLVEAGCIVEPELLQPGYIRAVVRRGGDATKIEWAYDTTWRFLPVLLSDTFGYQLHPIDLSINKVLALVGRDEPRDLLDTLHCHSTILPLGALVWAASGKDPGFSPSSLLELLRRRGRIRPEDLTRLHLAQPQDVTEIKTEWLEALAGAEQFVARRAPDEAGCLYYAPSLERFVDPDAVPDVPVLQHFGRPGGVLPRMIEET
jgi:hypothetical protein